MIFTYKCIHDLQGFVFKATEPVQKRGGASCCRNLLLQFWIWGSHNGGYEESVFWDITPCSPLSVIRRFGGTYRLHLQGRKNKLSKKTAWKQVESSAYFSTLKMEAICPSETSVDSQQTTRRYSPEDCTLYNILISLYSIEKVCYSKRRTRKTKKYLYGNTSLRLRLWSSVLWHRVLL
jgi:hypothetical protein